MLNVNKIENRDSGIPEIKIFFKIKIKPSLKRQRILLNVRDAAKPHDTLQTYNRR